MNDPAYRQNHILPTLGKSADRLAIRELVEAYAHCADRRDAKGQMSLFTADTHFVVYMNAKDPKPSQELHSRVRADVLARAMVNIPLQEEPKRESRVFENRDIRATVDSFSSSSQ